ncbi:leaf rust 10 disease-resistance locus receptor-like protein kinase-like 1.1 [Quercus suber]|uniref:Leaf rust 10 disease-resistance locus receptor-like protein kinase-like 1.1 n=1 Tax=Quercus suber TaxID=58331 RepID=A0AAW0KRL6_QUESU
MLHSAEGKEKRKWPDCLPLFQCGKFGTIGFPFTNSSHFRRCGLLPVNCDGTPPTIQLPRNLSETPYEVINISYTNTTQSIHVKDISLWEYLNTNKCEYLTNFTLPNSPFISFKLTTPSQSLFICNRTLDITSPTDVTYMGCGDHNNNSLPTKFISQCSTVLLPVKDKDDPNITAEFNLEMRVSDACYSCHGSLGQCIVDKNEKFSCLHQEKHKSGTIELVLKVLSIGLLRSQSFDNESIFSTTLILEDGLVSSNTTMDFKDASHDLQRFVGCAVFFMILVSFIIWHLYKKKYASSNFFARNTYSDPSSRSEVEGGSVYFGVPVYSYSELEEATNYFDIEKELGNGGFGTVYHGYVDPEYHQCYQLTSKSDVYSFGVVLIELISSLPAVDMFRHRHEINLANLALNKIGKCAFHELIDPYLGFESDTGVKTMTILVAKLAFQCLQPDKELRPSMDEALEALKNIQIGEDAPEDQEMACDDARILNVQKPASPDSDEVGLLRNKKPPPSPEAVTDNWTSRSTTPNFSGYTSPWC